MKTTPVDDRPARVSSGVDSTPSGEFRIWFSTTTGIIDFGRAPDSATACIIADLIRKHLMEPRRDGEIYRVRSEYFGRVGKHISASELAH